MEGGYVSDILFIFILLKSSFLGGVVMMSCSGRKVGGWEGRRCVFCLFLFVWGRVGRSE